MATEVPPNWWVSSSPTKISATPSIPSQTTPHLDKAETMIKGVLTDESRVEFDGMIRVRPKAQQTASFLSAHGLLLSNHAEGNSFLGLRLLPMK